MTQPVVRLGSPGEVARALPMLLGYYPTESVVISCLCGDNAALGLTLRFDLDGLGRFEDFADEIAERAEAASADAVFVAIFTDQPIADGALPYADLVEELLAHSGLLLQEVLLVHHRRWWSYLCDGDGCCPPEGVPLEGDTRGLTSLAASLVLSGSAVLADRESLVASLMTAASADTPAQRRRVTMAVRRVGSMRPQERRAALVELIDQLTIRFADPRASVTPTEAATCAALCADVEARDDLLLQAAPSQRRTEVLSVLRAVVTLVPPPKDAPVCAVLAWFAYASGDGTLVNIALDRALTSDPMHSLARLIESSLERQLPPSVIEEVVRGAAQDIAVRDAAG